MMFMLGCLFVIGLIALAHAGSPRRGIAVNDLSKVDLSKRPPPPAPMRRAGIEVPYRRSDA
jgi:hypothetical protein